MAKLCVYVMDHDTGYAPKITKKTCTLKGCMETNIEKNAKVGDWIIGIGGKSVGRTKGNEGKYDRKLIYAMKVTENINNAPRSTDLYYFFGDNAIELQKELDELAPKRKRFRKKYFESDEHHILFSTFEKFIMKHKRGKNGHHCDVAGCH